MVEFSQYVTPMDREYGKPSENEVSTNDVGVGVEDLGWGLPMGIGAQNIQGIAAKIREGAGNIEIQFAGSVTGQRQAQTPGMYGKEQRQAIKEMAEISEVNMTTHAAFGIMGLAGMDQRSGNFSDEFRKTAVDEIKRAVEFAAEAARGGSVVVHTGEYKRPISEESWAKDKAGNQLFQAYDEEPEEAVIRVVDERTGQIMTQVKKDQKVSRGIWRTSDGKEKHAGNHYVDYEDNPVSRGERVPEFDEKTGRFKVRSYEWEDFVTEAKEMNKENAKKVGMSVEEYKQKYYFKKDKHENSYVVPEEAFLMATLEANEGHARGWALQYAQGFEEQRNQVHKLTKSLETYKKIEAATPDAEKWKLKKDMGGGLSKLGLTPSEYQLPSEIIEETLRETRKRMEYEHEASVSQQQLALDSEQSQKHVMSAKKYALQKSFDSYAEAGLHALDQTRAKKVENNPVMVTMENIYPEQYGGHPDELKNLVLRSRERMAEMLEIKRGYSTEEAKKAAATHIKATLDVGHLNTWRKYWNNDPKKSVAENDSNFKNYIIKKTEELAKQGLIGNVHLADNYGYQDEHLTPGEGTTPIKEIVATLKKHGYKGPLTVEAGAAATTDVSDFHGLMKTWRLFGSPVYSAHGHVGRADRPKGNWGDIQYSYFGQASSPYYVFGAYSPSQDWTLWSQVQLE